MRRGIALLIIGISTTWNVGECAAAESGDRLDGPALERIAPSLRERIYADLSGVKTPLPPRADISQLSESPGYRHGCEQLRNAIRDRPGLGRDLKETDDLWIATAYLFGGAGTEIRAAWNPELADVPAGIPFAHTRIVSEAKTEVAVASREGGVELAPDQLWVGLIFELHNGLTNIDRFPTIEAKAKLEMVTRTEYIREYILAEYEAVRRTRLFYVDVYLPWVAAKKGRSSSPAIWYCEPPATGEDFVAHLAAEGTHHFELYSSHFDQARARQLYDQQRYAEAAHFFARVAREGLLDDAGLSAYRYLGYCRIEQRNFSAAIQSFQRALKLQMSASERAKLHQWIGYAYQEMGRWKPALAAIGRAKRECEIGPARRDYLEMQIQVAITLDDPKPLRALCEEYLRDFPDDRSCAEVERFREKR